MYYAENNHPAIIPRDIYDKAKNEMSRRASNRKVMQKHGKLSRVNMPGRADGASGLQRVRCPLQAGDMEAERQKRIVWRCVLRMEYGTKYCHHSPRLDEEKLHMAILAAINGFAAVEKKICPAVQQLAENARPGLPPPTHP